MTKNITDLTKVIILCVISVVTYTVLAGQLIWLPGIYYDEVLQAVPAISAIKIVNGPYSQVDGTVIDFAEYSFPLMILPYLGATQSAILFLAFALTSVSVPIMRATFITLGAIALIVTYLFTRRLFDTMTSFLASILLAVDPTYIFSTRSDNGPTAVMMICKMGALWLFLAWWQSHRVVYLWGGAFLIGVGLYDKVNFVWFVGALTVAIIFLYPYSIWQRLRQLNWMAWLGTGLSFFTGSIVFWVYTIFSGGGAFRGLLQIFSNQTAFGTDNTNLFFNFFTRLNSMVSLLSGYEILTFYTSTFNDYFYPYVRGYFPTTAIPWLLSLAIIFIVIQVLFCKTWEMHPRKTVFLFLLIILIVVASIITPTNLMYHHLLLAYPFPHLIVAHFIVKFPSIINNWQLGRFKQTVFVSISSTLAIVAIVMSLGVVNNYYRVLQETGGIGMWSNKIYALADYFAKNDRTVVTMDWGINLNLLTLSAGKLHTIDPWQKFIYTRDYSPEMEVLVTNPDHVFVFHSTKYTGIYALTDKDGPRITFFKTIEAIDAEPILEHKIIQSNGDVLFEIYTVSP